jgi:acyl transferase domain-containing protein
MIPGTSAVVFPGQGRLKPAPFRTDPLAAGFASVVGEITSGDDTLRRLRECPRQTPESLALFVFAASVAQYRVLVRDGAPPAALVGHGFGEIAALVCGGAFSARQGAEIVVRRVAALDRWRGRGGAMAILHASRPAVDRIVLGVGSASAAVAADNAPEEVVISGTRAGVARASALARARGIAVSPLAARWPLHGRAAMAGAADDLRQHLRTIRAEALHTPVFSPILGRYYWSSDDLVAAVAAHLTKPVRFLEAITYLSAAKHIQTFQICGPLAGLDESIWHIVHDLREGRRNAAAAPPAAEALAS